MGDETKSKPVRLSAEVLDEILRRGEGGFGDTYDDVLRRILDMPKMDRVKPELQDDKE